MFCPKCGAQVEDGLQFCSQCGAQLREGTRPPVPQNRGNQGKKVNVYLDLVNALKADPKEALLHQTQRPNVITLAAAVVGVIGAFLPYVTAKVEILGESSTSSSNYLRDWTGVLFFIFALICGVTMFLRYDYCSLVAAGISLLLVVLGFLTNVGDLSSISAYEEFAKAYFSIGFYLTLLAGVVMVLSPLLEELIMKNKK